MLSNFIADGAHTTDVGMESMRTFDREVSGAKVIHSHLLVQSPVDSPLPVHYLNALLAADRTFVALRGAAFWPNESADRYDIGQCFDAVQESERDYGEHRASFLGAAQERIGERDVGAFRRARRLGRRFLPSSR